MLTLSCWWIGLLKWSRENGSWALKMSLITNPSSQAIFQVVPSCQGCSSWRPWLRPLESSCLIPCPKSEHKPPIYFLGIDNVRFRKPVIPGDQLRLELEITKHRQSIWGFKGKALVDGKLVAEAELLAMLGDEK